MSETDLIELEEIAFSAPESELPVIVNPDRFLEKLFAQNRGPLVATPVKHRIRETVWRKVLICIPCMVGKCGKCEDSGCPCVHRDFEREKEAALGPPAEDYCWQV